MFFGKEVQQIHQLTSIDCWFLEKLKHIVEIDSRLKELRQIALLACDQTNQEALEFIEDPFFIKVLHEAKVYGFSDFQIARALGLEESMNMQEAALLVRRWRNALGITPTVSQIDTLAAEYPAQTNYLYLSYQ